MAPLHNADAPFTSGSPFLPLFEPALFFQLPAGLAPCISIGNRHPLYTQSLCAFFIGMRVITSIGRDQARYPAELALMRFQRRKQQMLIAWSLVIYLVMRDDLVLGFLHLH